MTVKTASNPTLVDVMSMPGMDEGIGEVVNLLAQFNPILDDAPAFECNNGSRHKTTIRTGLPTPTWGKLYKGIAQSKGLKQSIEDTTGFLESSAGVDQRLVDIVESAEGKASIRLEEAEGHLEAMAQEMATAMFYHDTATDPEKPMGFAPRFDSLAGAQNSSQVFDGGGAANLTSIWMITWDKKTNHLLYPKGSQAGIKRTDRGLQKALDGAGNPYYEYEEDFIWHMGLSVRDWRYVTRVANINVAQLSKDATTGVNLIDAMTEAHYGHYGRRKSVGMTKIYGNTDIVKYLDYQARNSTINGALRLMKDQEGPNAQEVLSFRGVDIRETDALINNEGIVS
ncbi:MAG: putative major capsid protein [Prokaryotic dsDNA virus sp.]|nr:hypothetical protein [Aequorivita sp.]QDP57314.1 MAG: putative major capsid protein [Prokaryotic dsDNA virus sp.]|tara:strand:+ start:6742 stop:7761 length:1020 start_codon:yes stop_codon:yes gene_type:complete